MILNGSAEKVPHLKMKEFIDCQPPSQFKDRPSPRVIMTHMPMELMPKDVFKKKSKIIFMVRNPKDVVTSYYYHVCKLLPYQTEDDPPSFSEVLELFMNEEGMLICFIVYFALFVCMFVCWFLHRCFVCLLILCSLFITGCFWVGVVEYRHGCSIVGSLVGLPVGYI